MQEYFLNKNKIYYRKNDFQENRQTLVFVHGISGSSSAWLAYEKRFSLDCNILSFDLRGHGKSHKPKNIDDYSIAKFASDLKELVKYLRIKNFVLISHSFGVLVVLDFLQKNMNLVSKLVFLSPNFAPTKISSAKFIKPFLNLVKIFSLFTPSQNGKTHIDYSRFVNTGDWNILRMFADIKNTSLRVYLYGTKQSYKVNYEKVIDKINIPTLIIHGRKDSIFPVSGSTSIHKKIKNSQLIVIENADHILVLNNFLEVSRAIDRFINRSFV